MGAKRVNTAILASDEALNPCLSELRPEETRKHRRQLLSIPWIGVRQIASYNSASLLLQTKQFHALDTEKLN
jgi:hypothetical protein